MGHWHSLWTRIHSKWLLRILDLGMRRSPRRFTLASRTKKCLIWPPRKTWHSKMIGILRHFFISSRLTMSQTWGKFWISRPSSGRMCWSRDWGRMSKIRNKKSKNWRERSTLRINRFWKCSHRMRSNSNRLTMFSRKETYCRSSCSPLGTYYWSRKNP